MTKNIERKLYRPFGPSVGKTIIPENLIGKINKYVGDIIKDQKKIKTHNVGHTLAGNVSQEFELDPEFIKESGWFNFLKDECGIWIQYSTGKKIKKFELIGSWVVRQFQNEYNPIHFHGGHVSGVGYLKVPKELGDTFQKNKKNNNGNINLVHGSKQFTSEAVFKIKPEIGNFYYFPNYLLHTVYPFYNENEERRSISFNATIDDEIYDVCAQG